MKSAKRAVVVVDGIPISLIEWSVFPPDVVAMTFPTFILIHPNCVEDIYLLEHEFEHLRQWRCYGPIVFTFRYLFEYLRGRLTGQSHQSAYLNISFEKAARVAAQAASDRDF